MSRTEEQDKIIARALDPKCKLLKVSACSGSGKTFTLVEVVKEVRPKIGMYIAYNKAIATEASTKFPKEIVCKTTHSLAYASTVRNFGLTIGFFGWRDIPKNDLKLHYDDKLHIVTVLENFFLSKYPVFKDYADLIDFNPRYIPLCDEILNRMVTGKQNATHSFYLKLYHILLANGEINPPELDILLLDEAGDLNEVTLEIFKAYPAKKKVMVGDPNQNIYSFNNTINGFEAMEGVGESLTLTQSFRVDRHIAHQVQCFARETFDHGMVFKGVTHKNAKIETEAYITRTNSHLIKHMLELNKHNRPYNLVRPVKSIFALPLALMGLKQGGWIGNPQFSYLQHDTDDYYKSAKLQQKFNSPLSYIANIHSDSPGVKSAINILMSHGAKAVLEAKDIAEKYEGNRHPYPLTLCTSHSSKGLEFDSVTIGDDTNSMVDKILQKPEDLWTPNEMEELRLAYVAVTRAKKELGNALFLDGYEGETLHWEL